jgi:hypothetical protein
MPVEVIKAFYPHGHRTHYDQKEDTCILELDGTETIAGIQGIISIEKFTNHVDIINISKL